MSSDAIKIHLKDNVAVALHNLEQGSEIMSVTLRDNIPQGHKFALQTIGTGGTIVKYGLPIGYASALIQPGQHVHTHNCMSQLTRDSTDQYQPEFTLTNNSPVEKLPDTFSGFLRSDNQAGIRNELWIIPTVGCVNSIATRLVQLNQGLVSGTLDGLYSFSHPYGCSQLGDDHLMTRRTLAALVRHPNAGGVLVLSLGCENNHLAGFQEELGTWDNQRVKFLVCQESPDEIAEGSALLAELAAFAKHSCRQELPVSKLVVGLKCGGSDGLSGITANPVVGHCCDLLVSRGGSAILTEIPEIFGAENLLMNRCVDETVFHKATDCINRFKAYFIHHGQPIDENPSPGNKAGGITTLAEKRCGCVQKAGHAPLTDVLDIGEPVRKHGLTLLCGPGNDLVSCTALTASGAQLILFTTGRGTPLGAPVPIVKISSNHDLSIRKGNWIDFDAGSIIDGEAIEEAAKRLYQLVLQIASGKIATRSEINGCREIAIFKDGVIL